MTMISIPINMALLMLKLIVKLLATTAFPMTMAIKRQKNRFSGSTITKQTKRSYISLLLNLFQFSFLVSH